MAVEEKKVLDAIELKFKGKSVTKDFKKNLAKSWAAKIDNDADIDAYINDREDVVLEASAEGDRRATAATKKPAEGTTTKAAEKATVEIDDEELKDAPAWAKALIAANKTLTDKVSDFESRQSQQTIATRFQNDERLKGIDAKLLKGRYPKTDEEFEAAVEEAAEDLKDFKTDASQGAGSNRSSDKPQFKGLNGSGAGKQEAQKPEVADALKHVKAYTDKLPGNTTKQAV